MSAALLIAAAILIAGYSGWIIGYAWGHREGLGAAASIAREYDALAALWRATRPTKDGAA